MIVLSMNFWNKGYHIICPIIWTANKKGVRSVGKSNLCEDKTAKRMNHVKRMLYGSLSQKYSNKEIADKLGMGVGTITKYFSRDGTPKNMTLETLYKLADMAGVVISFTFKDIPD